MIRTTQCLAAVVLALLASIGAAQVVAPNPPMTDATALFDPITGYRIAKYRAVVPSAPDGVPRIDAATVARLVDREHAILIDVMPAEGGVRDPVTGIWRLAKPRASISETAWFPEAGRGVLDPAIATWFDAGIARLRSRQAARPLVIFCLADCWMSWNASRRLAKAGYRNVYWFADGTDGWAESGRALVEVQPFEVKR